MFFCKNEFTYNITSSSYLHCEWASLEQLERDKRIHQKLKRFKAKQSQMRTFFQEVGLYLRMHTYCRLLTLSSKGEIGKL